MSSPDNTPKGPIIDHLSKLPLSELLSDQKPAVTLSDDTNIEKALRTLSRNKIRSAPVINTSNSEHPNRILGIIDTIDICYYVLQLTPNPAAMTKRELKNLFIESSDISKEKVYKIVDRSTLNPVNTFLKSKNLGQVVLKCLSKGVHRVLVVDGEKVVNTLSRSDIVRLLWREIQKGENTLLSQFGKLPIRDTIAHLDTKLVTCKEDDPVLVVLDRLHDCGHKSLPVVDANGKLVDNFSASEVTGLIRDAWPEFGEGVREYKTHLYKVLLNTTAPPLTYTKMDAIIGEVIQKLIGNEKKSIHCLWVVDDDMKPIGSVSLTDVLRFAAKWNGTEEQ